MTKPCRWLLNNKLQPGGPFLEWTDSQTDRPTVYVLQNDTRPPVVTASE